MTEIGWQLAKRAIHLSHLWWHGDTIRVSPAEGRLLRLRPPCYLRIRSQPVEVRLRIVQAGAGGVGSPAVIYHCQIGAKLGLLIVPVCGARQGLFAHWRVQDEVEEVAADDIEVYQGLCHD